MFSRCAGQCLTSQGPPSAPSVTQGDRSSASRKHGCGRAPDRFPNLAPEGRSRCGLLVDGGRDRGERASTPGAGPLKLLQAPPGGYALGAD
jgi:hypothetical protein